MACQRHSSRSHGGGAGTTQNKVNIHQTFTESTSLCRFIGSVMPYSGPLSPTTPSRLAFLIVFSLAFLTAKPVLSDSGAGKGASAPINTDDYFQIPTDLFLHGHSLVRQSEEIRTYTQLAHRVKTADGWKTSSEGQFVSIDHKLVSDSFFLPQCIQWSRDQHHLGVRDCKRYRVF
jgi:hypothetical protein